MAAPGFGAPLTATELVEDLGGERVRRLTAPAAAEEFEAILLGELLAAARRAAEPLGDDEQAAGAESYREIADRFLAGELARAGTLGLKELILQQIAPAEISPDR